MTIKELYELCKDQIRAGHGNYSVIISNDEEGNGYHSLFYPFLINQDDIIDALDSTESWGQIEEAEHYAMLG